jgi:hypothetical protein
MGQKLRKRTLIASLLVFMPTLLLIGLLKVPQFQTAIARWVAGYLSYEWKTEVFVESFYFDWGLDMHLENVVIFDQSRDTLCSMKDLSIAAYQWTFEDGWRIESLELDRPFFKGKQLADSSWNFDFIVDYYRQPEVDTTQSHFQIQLANVMVTNGSFVWDGLGPRSPMGMFDAHHISVKNCTGQFQDIMWSPKKWQCRIFDLNAEERCGLQLKSLSTAASGSINQISLKESQIKTAENSLSGDVELSWDKQGEFTFNDDVKWNAQLTGYPLNLSELRYFYQPAQNWKNDIQVQLNFKGTLNQLDIQSADVRVGMLSHAALKGQVSHLLDENPLQLDIDVDQLLTDAGDMKTLALWTGNDISIPANVMTLGLIDYEGHVRGDGTDWRLYGELTTDLGLLQGDVEADWGDAQSFTGYVQAENFALGQYYNNAEWEYISGDLNIEGKGFELANLQMTVDGELNALRYKGYTFGGIKLNGDLANRFFLGDVVVDDPNAHLEFVGQCDLSKKIPELICNLSIDHFNVKAIGAFPQVPYSAISGDASMDIHGSNWNDLVGELELKNVMYCSNSRDYILDYLSLTVSREEHLKVALNSDIAIGEINGDIDLKSIPASVMNIISKVLPQYDWEVANHKPQKFDLSFEILDFSQVNQAFLSDLGISQNARIRVEVDESKDFFEGLFTADTVGYEGVSFYGLVCDFQKPDEFVYATIQADSIKTGGIQFDHLSLDARSEGELIFTDWVWGNDSTMHEGDFGGQLTLNQDKILFEFYRGDFRVKKEKWKLDYGASVLYENDVLWFKGMEMRSDWQHIVLHGGVAGDHETPLIASFTHVNFDILNAFMPKDIQFQGVLDGNVSCVSILDDPDFNGDVSMSDFGINHIVYGDGCLKSQWGD